jgi:hypothetical protein
MKTVPELQAEIAEIAEIQKHIKIIQSVCPHISYETALYSWRPGAMSPTRVCLCCKAVIPGITDEESKKLWEEYYKDANDFTN